MLNNLSLNSIPSGRLNVRNITFIKPYIFIFYTHSYQHILNAHEDASNTLLESLLSLYKNKFLTDKEFIIIKEMIKNIISISTNLKQALNEQTLRKTARKKYTFYFTSKTTNFNEITDIINRYNYISLLLVYETLKTSNKKLKYSWKKILFIYRRISTKNTYIPVLAKHMSNILRPRILVCQQTSIYLRRLAYVLQIYEEFSHKDGLVKVKGKYIPNLTYNHSLVFKDKLHIKRDITQKKKNIIQQAPSGEYTSSLIEPHRLDSMGSKKFNKGAEHLLSVQINKFEIEKKIIMRSIYIETPKNRLEGKNHKNLIFQLTSKSFAKKSHVKSYSSFLYIYFNQKVDELLSLMYNYDVSSKNIYIFLYNLGPRYMFYMMIHALLYDKVGFVHYRISHKQIAKKIPIAVIKYFFIHWWDFYIYSKVTKEDKNNDIQYKQILMDVNRHYKQYKSIILDYIAKQTSKYKIENNSNNVKFIRKASENSHLYMVNTIYTRFLGLEYIYKL